MTSTRYARRAAACAAALLAWPAGAEDAAGDGATRLPDVEVIGVTPLSGAGTPVDRVPYRVQVAGPDDFESDGQTSVYDFFDREMAGASAVDVQNNPYQKNFSYRGFVAGPLLGESVGIAAFLDGVRINDPFGDVVQSDLFPEMAIARIELGNADPAFGFNALGGALVLRTHDGTSFQGLEVSQSGGSFGRLRTTLRAGREAGRFNSFLALQRDSEDGWRDASPSELDRLFANAGFRGESGSMRLDLAFADTDLIGNGLAPAELHAIAREANFTTPDRTLNNNLLVSGSGELFAGGDLSIQANVYVRRLRRQTLNGDEIDAETCAFEDGDDLADVVETLADNGLLAAGPVPAGFVCGGDDDDDEGGGEAAMGGGDDDEEEEEEEFAILLDQDKKAIASYEIDEDGAYGALNRSSTQTTAFGGSVQAALDRPLGGMENRLVIGVGVDTGRTEFYSTSEVGRLLPSRAVVGGPGGRPNFNTGIVEIGLTEDEPEPEVAPEPEPEPEPTPAPRPAPQPAPRPAEPMPQDTCPPEVRERGECPQTNAAEAAEPEVGETAPVALTARNRYLRAYLSDTLRVNANLSVTASAAANWAEIELTDEGVVWGERQTALRGDHDYFSLNPAIGAAYEIPGLASPVTLFGGFRQGSRAPSPAELSCADPDDPCNLPNAFVADPPLEQVTSRTFEAGLRGRMARERLGGLTSLDWSASAYRATNSDDIIFVSAGVGLSSGYFKNVAETRRQGFDLTLAGDGGRFDWFLNYSYVEATFQSPFEVSAENHPMAEDGEIPVEAGDAIPGVPAHSLGAGVDVEPLDGLRVSPSVVYRSGVHLRGDEGNLLPRTDGYAVANLDASYRIADWIEAFGRIENIFDKRYETFGVLGETGDEVPIRELPGGITDPRFISPGQPFAAMVGVRIRLN